MEALGTGNDTRGWIMCLVSGVACVLGASVIGIDILIRMIPGKKDFNIQESNTFLACSLSLSFGVMVFMSLYSMLPEAKSYLKKGGVDEQPAGFILMGCFLGGFVGIQIISRLFHRLLPSHVVDCDHSHDEQATESNDHANSLSRKSSRARSRDKLPHHHDHEAHPDQHNHANGAVSSNGAPSESTPLLPTAELMSVPRNRNGGVRRAATGLSDGLGYTHTLARFPRSKTASSERRPSMLQVQKRVMSFVKDTKTECDESGPCFGYSDPCGQECFKHLSSRASVAPRYAFNTRTTRGSMARPVPSHVDEEGDGDATAPTSPRAPSHRDDNHEGDEQEMNDCDLVDPHDLEAQHHHHVAENAFLSIGLQTSIAIALHKFPEGFITYATNHANPSLGFSVFLALFVHNISEGFAMALPLYMALNSRLKAMIWSSLLGGLSQPFGAAIAALWFKVAKHTNMTPDAVAYGVLFAITAGIMANVALQLFVESLSLNHNRNLSILFAFLGMALMGFSSAFTSEAH